MSEPLDLGPDIIVCEYDGESRLHIPLTALDVLYESRIRPLKGVVVLAPAGNDETRAPTFPAAHDWVIAVGAPRPTGARADFSNYEAGSTCTRRVKTSSTPSPPAHTGIEHPHKGERRNFDGMAKWSGTSFSTPLVAGMIAARMSATGENAPRAAEALLRFARRQAIPESGRSCYRTRSAVTPTPAVPRTVRVMRSTTLGTTGSAAAEVGVGGAVALAP